jgi:para-aminobenzoate synthetase / 4-amino-4-deoxychorismate lyase
MIVSPAGVFAALDFPDGAGVPRRLCFARPLKIVSAHAAGEVLPALREVRRAAESGLWAAGFVGYEAAPAFDAALAVRPAHAAPLLWFAVFDRPAGGARPEGPNDFRLSEWTPSVDWPTYRLNFDAAREAIARGDTYQINYSFRLRARFQGDAFALYERLAAGQRADYCAYIDTGRHRVLSASPELFFRLRGREIETRPMKGTSRRGLWAEEDEALARRLAGSEKNRAENVMIVDLLRNDLGRVAEAGSVEVSDLCRVERYPTVFQMTSTVRARAREGVVLEDLFAAAFPCGSVTGAPKVSTMRLIARLEDSPRGVYCGAVGLVEPGGDCAFNVAIRTVLIDSRAGAAEYGVGGGITWDSEAACEYEEAFTKAALLAEERPRFRLLETLRLEGGEFALLERHLRRLADSARYFGFRLSDEGVCRALSDHARAHAAGGPRRVRLLLAEDGATTVESEGLIEPPHAPLPVALAREPVARGDRFLYHKTTRRETYDSRRAAHPEAFDVLLRNEDGELTEFTNGNLVVESDGRRLTPRRESGLLAGTMRAELLERGEIEEATLTPADLARATRLWFINSVRGWVPVYLADS